MREQEQSANNLTAGWIRDAAGARITRAIEIAIDEVLASPECKDLTAEFIADEIGKALNDAGRLRRAVIMRIERLHQKAKT